MTSLQAAKSASVPEFHVVIPARMGSSRLPGKPLADLGGKPMIVRVWERALETGAQSVWVATDSEHVAERVRAAGGQALLTRADHATGTDRIAEVAAQLGWAGREIVVNLQGDEPFFDPTLAAAGAQCLSQEPSASIATACHRIQDWTEFLNPNVVKVLRSAQGMALSFSRAPIPWPRALWPDFSKAVHALEQLPADHQLPIAWRHIGFYAYRVDFLQRFSSLPPSGLEATEALEQWRALEQGFGIAVFETDSLPVPGIDTPADLERARQLFARQHTL